MVPLVFAQEQNRLVFYVGLGKNRSKILQDQIKLITENNQETLNALHYVKKLSEKVLETKSGIDIFRGDSDNVLSRYYECAKFFSFGSILRVTADCSLIDPLIVDKGASLFLENNYDYVTNTSPRTFPDGNETEFFSFSALELAYKNAILPSEREHVTPYFRNNKEKFKIHNFSYDENISHLRWTLDYADDLKLIKILISKIHTRPIHMTNILEILKNEPDLVKINQIHKPNEGYFKSLKEDDEFIRKSGS